MKRIIAITAFAGILCAGAVQAKGYHYAAPKGYAYHASKVYTPRSTVVPVSGYFRKDGTYVTPSHRTAPNATKTDNWSSKPNVNPYTGKEGTKDPYKTTCCGA